MKAPASRVVVQEDFLSSLFRPLLSARAAAWLLAVSEDHVVRMVEEGAVRGFDLSTPVANAAEAEEELRGKRRDRFIRIARYSVERIAIPACRALPPTFDLARLLPHGRETLLRREVEQLFDCGDDHVRRLQSAGLLTGPLLTRHGSGRAHHIDRASLLTFLAAREIGVA